MTQLNAHRGTNAPTADEGKLLLAICCKPSAFACSTAPRQGVSQCSTHVAHMDCGGLCGPADVHVTDSLPQQQKGVMHLLMHRGVSAVDMLEEPIPGDDEEPAPDVKEGKKKRRRNP